jgi:hypothetical protein
MGPSSVVRVRLAVPCRAFSRSLALIRSIASLSRRALSSRVPNATSSSWILFKPCEDSLNPYEAKIGLPYLNQYLSYTTKIIFLNFFNETKKPATVSGWTQVAGLGRPFAGPPRPFRRRTCSAGRARWCPRPADRGRPAARRSAATTEWEPPRPVACS